MASPSAPQVAKSGTTFSAEKIAKIGTLALPVIYVCGFVIISLYEADFGIADFTLIKVKALAAGLGFGLFLAVPALAGIRSFRILGMRSPGGTRVDLKDDSQRVYLHIIKIADFYFLCVFLSMAFSFLFARRLRVWVIDTPTYQQPGHFSWLVQNAGIVTVLTFMFPIIQHSLVARNFARKPVRCTVLVGLTFALWAIWTLRMSDWLFFQVTAWFYLVGLCAVLIGTLVSRGLSFTRADWEFAMLLGLSAAISWFATSMYGDLRPAFGGGYPIPARLYLQQNNPVLGTKIVDTTIIEETEQGYYVTGSIGKKEALFIPRSFVTSVQLGKTP